MAAFDFGQGQTNYTGEVLADLLTYAAQENETYKNGLIHIKSGIQKKYTLPGISLGNIIQDRVPTPTTSVGQYTFAERYLEPEDVMIYLEFNPRDFEEYYKPFQPNGNLVFRELDPKVQATMARLLLEREMEWLNQTIWCGATATEAAKVSDSTGANTGATVIGSPDAYNNPTKYFNGAIMRMLMNKAAAPTTEDAKSGQITLAGTGTFADGQAVEKELYAMWQATEPKFRNQASRVILMDYKTWDMYDQYLTSQQFKYRDNRNENEHTFKGKRIIPMVALPEDTIIMGNFTTGMNSNLWMGVDYANDENVLQVEKLQANSELHFFKMLLKIDVNIVRPAEITAHLPFQYS